MFLQPWPENVKEVVKLSLRTHCILLIKKFTVTLRVKWPSFLARLTHGSGGSRGSIKGAMAPKPFLQSRPLTIVVGWICRDSLTSKSLANDIAWESSSSMKKATSAWPTPLHYCLLLHGKNNKQLATVLTQRAVGEGAVWPLAKSWIRHYLHDSHHPPSSQ